MRYRRALAAVQCGPAEDVLAERDATLATALADKALAEKDREFFREQYMQASGFVSSVRIENIELEKKAATADARAAVSDQRAKDGVAGIRALYESRIKTLQDELERERALMRILQERDARTGGDKIRRQAAEAAEIQEELANLREDYEEAVRGYEQIRGVYDRVYEERMYLEKRAKKLKKQKQNLVMQLAELGLQPLDAEVTQDGTTDDGQGVVDGEERESIVIERMVVQEREVSDEEVSDDEDRDEDDLADGPYPPDADESSFDYAQAVLEDVEDLDELFYQCLWRPGNGEHCPRAFDSIEDLERHVRSEHVAATP
ncbi:hypothetical protein CONPUDRAFT_169355 [Coniophora puteana RWD-64-598 SS2]|uniref:C2H2-type domain-containing protein n=1 Tax=Coniophora puteana (strain RWD-64-598) TaxID=741705 RepID=A0A5M3M8Y1_CONPW|nr:uncharacterized protein CONPUDRAFT_169355 [Coniophora puteana RWD-64-598 SS2]EIW75537.1 hypothetical protein CONPUDRAFT_169355 [Coniophora puteana RWD-64-598 SS2]